MVKITTLIDNRKSQELDQDLTCEHGLSLLIETQSLKILCDMGASEAFATNAAKLSLELSDIDFALLSHAHADHTGGLAYFLDRFKAPIYLSNRVFGHRYYSTRHTSKRDISCDNSLLEPHRHAYRFVEESCTITPDISLVTCDIHKHPQPHANTYLRVQPLGGCEQSDDFKHEIALAITTDRGLVIISPCSHNGAANIIAACQRFTATKELYAFIGGLHFVDGEHTTEEVSNFASTISTLAPTAKIYTGHCTGTEALQQLQELLPNTVNPLFTGQSIVL